MHEAHAAIHKIDGNAVTLDEMESSKKRKFTVEAFASDLVEGGPGLNMTLTQMNARLGQMNATLAQMNATLAQMNATLGVLAANSTRMRNNEKVRQVLRRRMFENV
jgi:hypothetical protein